MTKMRIVVGPEAMYVERDDVKSKEVKLTASDDVNEVMDKAKKLMEKPRHNTWFSFLIGIFYRIVGSHK